METFFAILLATAITLGFTSVESDAVRAFTQASDVQKRTEDLLAAFNKRKHKVKEKYGIRKELYVEIKSEPAVRKDPREYSGRYEVSGQGDSLNIQVASDGTVNASGLESLNYSTQATRAFTLRDAKIEGILLTGAKVYGDGATEKFEGIFINRTDLQGVSPQQIEHRNTAFGLGTLRSRSAEQDGFTSERLFYQQTK
jgi:hypothetical protein